MICSLRKGYPPEVSSAVIKEPTTAQQADYLTDIVSWSSWPAVRQTLTCSTWFQEKLGLEWDECVGEPFAGMDSSGDYLTLLSFGYVDKFDKWRSRLVRSNIPYD